MADHERNARLVCCLDHLIGVVEVGRDGLLGYDVLAIGYGGKDVAGVMLRGRRNEQCVDVGRLSDCLGAGEGFGVGEVGLESRQRLLVEVCGAGHLEVGVLHGGRHQSAPGGAEPRQFRI